MAKKIREGGCYKKEEEGDGDGIRNEKYWWITNKQKQKVHACIGMLE